MPARRSQRREVAPEPTATLNGSNDMLAELEGLSQRLASAVGTWDDGGQETITTLLASLLRSSTSSSSSSSPSYSPSIATSHLILSLLTSSLSADALAEAFTTVLAALDGDLREDQVAVFAEALSDVADELHETEEDCRDLQGVVGDGDRQGNRVDSGAWVGEKGLEVIKILCASGYIPSIIPNLILTPDYPAPGGSRNPPRLAALSKAELYPPNMAPPGVQRASVKRNTTLFYKQSKYNLLRESSEGFAALIVLLTGPEALPHNSSTGGEDVDDIEARQNRAQRVWAKILSLIGYFNLSPPRVLDLVLEIASKNVTNHWRFYLDLLRCSPWGQSALAAEQEDKKGKGKANGSSWASDELTTLEEALRLDGDRVLAQVLGVKFSFAKKTDVSKTEEGVVTGQYMLAALLVKHRFISLADLPPFLSPDDEQMEVICRNWKEAVGAKQGNALANAAMLVDDEPTPTANGDKSTTAEEGAEPAKPPAEQRVILLQAFLSIGDVPSAQYLLAKHPWLAQSHPAIADLIVRIVDNALEELYVSSCPTPPDLNESLEEIHNDAVPPRSLRSSPVSPRETVLTMLAPTPPSTRTKDFAFFYPEWNRGLERWQTPLDIHTRGLRWLSLVRGLAGRSPSTMVKICRIGAAYFQNLRKEKESEIGLGHRAKTLSEQSAVEPTAEQMRPWLDIIRRSLLPALSASDLAASFDLELWALVGHFPYTVRYALYGEWRDSTCFVGSNDSCPIAARAARQSKADVKAQLKRVTAPTTTPGQGATAVIDRRPARKLAKLSHANPCALWIVALNQVKSYSNIGEFIIEAGRYMNQLSMDVATFTLVDALSNPHDSDPEGRKAPATYDWRLGDSGSPSAPLQNVAAFVADFNRRYGTMDLLPVLQFIINRLVARESVDLVILDKLLEVMSGNPPIENNAFSADQLQAFAGGPELLREAFTATMVDIADPAGGQGGSTKPKSTKKSLPRFMNMLKEAGMAIPLEIALAQTKLELLDKMEGLPIKAIAATQDAVHDTFIRYTDLLSEQLSPAEHIALTPDLRALVTDYGLKYSLAFQILRPRLVAELAAATADDKAALRQRLASAKEALSLQIPSPVKENASLPPSPTSPSVDSDGERDGDVPMASIAGNGSGTIPPPKKRNRSRDFPKALRPTMEQARDLLPLEVNNLLSAPFFVIFWQLVMSDIAVSTEAYTKADARLKSLIARVQGFIVPQTKESEKQSEIKRLEGRRTALSAEREVQQKAVEGMKRRLQKESARWFGKGIAASNQQKALSFQLHQYCFLPRAVHHPADAVFVARFIKMAHEFGTLSFSTLFAYERFFDSGLAACLFSMTIDEARNYGRCLSTIMTDLDAWHKDEAVYKREALCITDKAEDGTDAVAQLPGMFFRTRTGVEPRPMTWNQFRQIYAKFHTNLSRALDSCFAQGEFIHVQNALTVALEVIKSFPLIKDHRDTLNTTLKGLDLKHMPDLETQTDSYKKRLEALPRQRTLLGFDEFIGILKPKVVTSAPPSGPAKGPPTAPRSASGAHIASTGTSTPVATTNGAVTPAPAPPTPARDAQTLRRELEEKRKEAANGSARAAELASSANDMAGTPSAAPDVKRETPSVVPSGPRATRQASSNPGTNGTTEPVKGAAVNEAKPVPTGPALSGSPSALPSKPGSSMAPPAPVSIEEERRLARARKFGTISQALPPTGPSAASSSSKVDSGAAASPHSRVEESIKGESPAASPAHRTRRSGSVESRLSERSRRDRRVHDDKERERERGDIARNGESGNDDRSKDDKPSATPSATVESETERQRLLATRDGALESRDGARRSSREERRRETDKERDERKAKERERERERDKRGSDAGPKRKREDELPRRIDDPRDRDRDRAVSHRRDGREPRRDERRHDRRDDPADERRDRDRRDDREPPRRDEPPKRDDPRDDRDRTRRRRERDVRDARDSKDPRDTRELLPSEPRRERSAEKPREDRDRRETRSTRGSTADVNAQNGDRTPRRDETTRIVDARPDTRGASDRIVEAPRTRQSEGTRPLPVRPERPETPRASRPADSTNGAGAGAGAGSGAPRGPHALPARPGPAGDSSRSASSTGGELAARMGSLREREHDPRSDAVGPAADDDRSAAGAGSRKRPMDEGPPSREESPGTGKRVKIDRGRMQRAGREGINRMMGGAMRDK